MASGAAGIVVAGAGGIGWNSKSTTAPYKTYKRTLFGVLRAPCDTTLREVCDEIAPYALHSEGALDDYR